MPLHRTALHRLTRSPQTPLLTLLSYRQTQNVAQNAEPKAAAAAPAAAAVLPQTGANWLAVVGSALSGLFLLAAGFVLDRKNRRMN